MHLDLVKLKLAHSPVPPTVYLCPTVAYHFSILEESGVDQQVKSSVLVLKCAREQQ